MLDSKKNRSFVAFVQKVVEKVKMLVGQFAREGFLKSKEIF
jgi:hypothetical protein